jgi:hypothetical protein
MLTEEQLEKLINIVKNSPLYEAHVIEDIMQALVNMRDKELLVSRMFEEWDELGEWDEEEK